MNEAMPDSSRSIETSWPGASGAGRAALLSLATCAFALALSACGGDDSTAISEPRIAAPKVMLINMFDGEAKPFQSALGLTVKYQVEGLSQKYPEVLCNGDGICQLTTGMGYANAAASVTALLYSGPFDLKHTYFIIAGIAGINPSQGTIGSAAWAKYLVDYSIAHEVDAREAPAAWPYGYYGIGAQSPTDKPSFGYRTEIFQLDEALVDRAYTLSKSAVLEDSAEAQAFRAHYTGAPANQPPAVLRCDTVSGDTWFAGTALAKRAEDWMKLLTDDKGTYCTTQQEDNSTLEALRRGDAAGRIDLKRVLVLRAASDMDRPYPGQSSADGLINYGEQGGFVPATQNLMLTASPVIRDIVSQWNKWADGVPAVD